MEVYRITTTKWSKKLQASGFPARWNSKGIFMIYTSGSRALASLENIVHRSGEGLNKSFKTMVIEIPKSIKYETVNISELKNNWFDYQNYHHTQIIGDKWIEQEKTCILKVPSSIIIKESNFLINPNHKNFKKIKIKLVEDFKFDPRLIKNR